MGILGVVGKELANVKENVPFNLATVVSPLLFLLAFAVMVSGGITIPVETQPAASESAFLQATADFQAPDGTPSLALETAPVHGVPTKSRRAGQAPAKRRIYPRARFRHRFQDKCTKERKNSARREPLPN